MSYPQKPSSPARNKPRFVISPFFYSNPIFSAECAENTEKNPHFSAFSATSAHSALILIHPLPEFTLKIPIQLPIISRRNPFDSRISRQGQRF